MEELNQEEEHKGKAKISPLAISQLICPVCDYREVQYHALKAKSLATKPNLFSVSIYQETPKFTLLDFNELTFTVCPECYFTSNDRGDFLFEGQYSSSKESKADAGILRYWKEHKSDIENVIFPAFVDATAFKHPRTPEAIDVSYKLGIHRQTIDIQRKMPYAYYKRARTYLKYHYIFQKLYEKENEEFIKLALPDLEIVFEKSDFPDQSFEFEVCFLIVAICLKLKNEEKAQSYIKVLDLTKGEVMQKSKIDPKVTTVDITRWLTKAKELWQSKNDPMMWDLMKPSRL